MPESIIKILIVDDEPDLAEALSYYFDIEGIEVQTSSSGEDALAKLAQDSFQVVISDIRMPQMNGIELLERIKDLYGSKIAVFLMTGFADYDKTAVLKAGALDLFRKPDDLPKMTGVVCGYLNKLTR